MMEFSFRTLSDKFPRYPSIVINIFFADSGFSSLLFSFLFFPFLPLSKYFVSNTLKYTSKRKNMIPTAHFYSSGMTSSEQHISFLSLKFRSGLRL